MQGFLCKRRGDFEDLLVRFARGMQEPALFTVCDKDTMVDFEALGAFVCLRVSVSRLLYALPQMAPWEHAL